MQPTLYTKYTYVTKHVKELHGLPRAHRHRFHVEPTSGEGHSHLLVNHALSTSIELNMYVIHEECTTSELVLERVEVETPVRPELEHFFTCEEETCEPLRFIAKPTTFDPPRLVWFTRVTAFLPSGVDPEEADFMVGSEDNALSGALYVDSTAAFDDYEEVVRKNLVVRYESDLEYVPFFASALALRGLLRCIVPLLKWKHRSLMYFQGSLETLLREGVQMHVRLAYDAVSLYPRPF